MENSVLFNNPVVLIGFIIALCLCVFSLVKKTHVSVTFISAAIFTLTLIYALLNGMELYEAGAVATVFFTVNLLSLWKKGGSK